MSPDPLDETLQAWAAQVALPTEAAEAVYQRITAPPPVRARRRARPAPGVDPRWWNDFSARLATTIVTTTRPRRPVLS